MKFTSAISAAIIGFAGLSSAITVSYDEGYDQAGRSMNAVTCSDGQNGLASRFPTQGNLPHFPLIGGFQGTTWNSPQCGTCYKLTYNGISVNILVIDNANGFNIAKGAMNALTNGRAEEVGRVDASYEQVAASNCGL